MIAGPFHLSINKYDVISFVELYYFLLTAYSLCKDVQSMRYSSCHT